MLLVMMTMRGLTASANARPPEHAHLRRFHIHGEPLVKLLVLPQAAPERAAVHCGGSKKAGQQRRSVGYPANTADKVLINSQRAQAEQLNQSIRLAHERAHNAADCVHACC